MTRKRALVAARQLLVSKLHRRLADASDEAV